MRHAVPPWAAASSRNASAHASITATTPSSAPGPRVASPLTTAPSAPTRAVTSAPRPATSPRPSSTANRNRPGNSASRGRAHSAASRSCTIPVRLGPPSRPASGEASTLRTRSWLSDGSSPARVSSSVSGPPTPAASARNCTLPREVSSTRPSPNSPASRASTRICPAPISPPGSRIRARYPSAASVRRSTPGHRSAASRPRPRPAGLVAGTRGFYASARQIDWLIPTAARNALSSVLPELRYGRAVLTADAPGAECRIADACKKSDIADAQAD